MFVFWLKIVTKSNYDNNTVIIVIILILVILQVPHPYLSPLVDLSREGTMYGLSERIIATESL